jgi:SAM-dependent methyltransferase
MNCRICGNSIGNKTMSVREMQHGLRERFQYIICVSCGCIQISDIPNDMARYYPSDYYSFDSEEGKEFLSEDLGFFKKHQADYLTGNDKNIMGRIFSMRYIPPRVYHWIRTMQLKKHHRVLDIGCGTGLTLKRMYQIGFTNLTGVDPFIKQDYTYSDTFHVYKKDPLQMDESNKYDCIMMHHSFEHMEFEKEVLKKCERMLHQDGKMLVRIPVVSEQLMSIYKTDLVSLDAPRHFYIHTTESMKIISGSASLKIDHVEYDADASSFWASEQYKNDIPLTDERSYGKNRSQSGFTKTRIRDFKKQISRMNKNGTSDTAAFYLSKS